MFQLPSLTWIRFAVWLVIGLVLYFAYGYQHSTLSRGKVPVATEHK
jgi:APA family basic amino acid/polyamine antiporter